MTGLSGVRCLVAIAAVGGALTVMLGRTLAQDATVQVVEVVEPRPLARAVLELENRFGWIITFEDPDYEFQDDLQDVTWTQRQPTSTRLLVPRTKLFQFSFDQHLSSRPDELIPAMLRSYEEAGNSDAYKVVSDGTIYHVLPIRSANAKGILTERSSRLEARVTMEHGSRTALELLTDVLDQVSAKSGRSIWLGLAPLSTLNMTRITVGAQNERARDVIVRLLAATNQKLSWQLFCDPSGLRLCMFNVHVVPS